MRTKQGQLIIGGRNLSRMRRFKLSSLRRRMGTCTQHMDLLAERTVRENLLLPFVARGKSKQAPKQVEKVLEQLELSHKGDLSVACLSEQERRVINIARAIVGEPEFILIDGGLDGLDDVHQRRLLGALRQAHDNGSTIITFSRRPLTLRGVASIEMRLDHGKVRLIERVHQSPSPEHSRLRRR